MHARPGPPPSSFDSVVLAAVIAECGPLIGARLSRLAPVESEGVILGLRGAAGPQRLLISIHPQWGRVHLTKDADRARGAAVDVHPFVQQARSRLEGGVLRSVFGPPFERILVCAFDTLEGPCDLVAEIIGRHSNIILRAGGMIAGAQRLVRPDGPRGREILPHRPYIPPPQPRPDPTTVTVDDLLRAAQAEANERPAWRIVLDSTAGIGAPAAHEVCLRAGIDPLHPLAPESADAVIERLWALGQDVGLGRFAPVLYRDRDGTPVAYAAFPMRLYDALQAEPASMSAAVDAITARAAEATRVGAVRTSLSATVAQATRRVQRSLEAVRGDAHAAAEAERHREAGELLLAYLKDIAPGATAVEVPGFDGQPTTIALDPALTGVENAQAYFKRYGKAAGARTRLPAREAALVAEHAFLEELATAIGQADGEDDLWEIEQDLIAAGLRRRTRRARQARGRPRAVSADRVWELGDGQRVRVGRSARENDHLTFEAARPDDLWLHARGMPGAHVILSSERRAPTEAGVTAAARIAAHYSAGRGSARVPVDVTHRRYVRRVRGGRPGQVTYTNERTLMVAPGLPGRRRGD